MHPTYNETFMFNLPPDQARSAQLTLRVMDYDKMSKDDVIGIVSTGSQSNEAGQKQWSTMLLQKGLGVSVWHNL